MTDLKALRDAADAAGAAFDKACRTRFPDSRWGYYRVMDMYATRDKWTAAGVTDAMHAACDAYIAATHAYYNARDGEKGFLGGRCL